MKIYYLFAYLIICFSVKSYGQDYPFFQQLAFDFYSKKIIPEFPVNKKITISKSLSYDFDQEIFYIPNCLKISVPEKINDSIKLIDLTKYYINDNRFYLNLNGIDKKQFKVRKNLNDNFPQLIILFPKTYDNRVFVIIHEKWEIKGNYYVIEFDTPGNIVDWCKSEYISFNSD